MAAGTVACGEMTNVGGAVGVGRGQGATLEASVVVVANATALPGWAQRVEASHHPVLVGGVIACLRCSSIVATRAEGTALARRIDFSALEAVDPSVAPALYKALNELAVGRQRESSW